jgi:hypothetical protein
MAFETDTSGWSGEGAFTQLLIERMQDISAVRSVKVEDAPTTRSEADYQFMSNELFVEFATSERSEQYTKFGFLPARRTITDKSMTLTGLEAALTAMADVGAPDYSDDGMLQYLRTERIIPPYQTRGYKLVELIRIYEAGTARRG